MLMANKNTPSINKPARRQMQDMRKVACSNQFHRRRWGQPETPKKTLLPAHDAKKIPPVALPRTDSNPVSLAIRAAEELLADRWAGRSPAARISIRHPV